MIEDTSYERNEFIFNIAFVFDRLSDLSAFEPVVRKCGRIMRAAEVSSHVLGHPRFVPVYHRTKAKSPFLLRHHDQLDTRWLSTKTAQPKIQSVLEQLHEDLNSYSATSIVLDGINSLDLTLFPFYGTSTGGEARHREGTGARADLVILRGVYLANPPPVHDWHVPVALIDFQKLKDANWDITASKVSIEGVLH